MILIKYIILFFILLTHYNSVMAFTELWDQQPAQKNALATFYYRAGDADALAKTDLYFLTSSDCSEGLLAHYPSSNFHFPITLNTYFSLRADSTYQALSAVLSEDNITKIHSVLIRFMGTNGALPRFLTACADQGINCCINVHCAPETQTCTPIYDFPTQVFILYQKLID